MKIIPAIDIRRRRCVRLYQGKKDRETIFSYSPIAAARMWEEKGAKLLHVVDLDGAFCGKPENMNIVRNIIRSVDIPVQVGGGIRTLNTIERYIIMGAEAVVLGTMAVKNPEFLKEATKLFPGKIIASIDAKDEYVAIEGWTEISDENAIDLAKRLESYGVKAIIFTDIKRDGTMVGPNIESIKKVVESVNIPVIASGGVSKIEDIKALKELEELGLEGVIIGSALYTGRLDLESLIKTIS